MVTLLDLESLKGVDIGNKAALESAVLIVDQTAAHWEPLNFGEG